MTPQLGLRHPCSTSRGGDSLDQATLECGTDLCALPTAAVRHIITLLPIADRRRLGATCHRMQQQCVEAVQTLSLWQQDECIDDALTAFPVVGRLELVDTDLSGSCCFGHAAAAVLQKLKSLQITSPSSTEVDAVLQLVSSCSSLSELCIKGPCIWESSSSLHYHADQLAPALQRLVIQRNDMTQQQLLSLLSVAPCDHDGTSGSPQAAAAWLGSSSSSSGAPQQPPGWCQALWGMSMHSMCQAPSSSSSSSHLHAVAVLPPRWPHLTALDLTACVKLGGSLSFLGLCPALQSLTLHSCFKVTDTALQELHTALSTYSESAGEGSPTGVATDVCGDTDAAASSASSAPIPLQQLDLSYTRVKDAGMPHLVSTMPQLSKLSLKGCNVGDDGLLHLPQLQHLTALHIKHCHRVTDEGIRSLSLSGLCSLSYGYTSMPEADDMAAAIAQQFTALTALDLLASELTDSGLLALSRLPQLQLLKLYQAGVTASGLEQLAEQPAGKGLTGLVLYGTGALAQLSCLGAFPALQELQLGRLCDLAAPMEQALQQLTVLQQLTGLTLERMDDCSVGCLQDILKGCKQLQMLRVRGCDGVSQEDMEGLALHAAAVSGSSASVWWAVSPSVDTDDEEEGWQAMQPV